MLNSSGIKTAKPSSKIYCRSWMALRSMPSWAWKASASNALKRWPLRLPKQLVPMLRKPNWQHGFPRLIEFRPWWVSFQNCKASWAAIMLWIKALMLKWLMPFAITTSHKARVIQFQFQRLVRLWRWRIRLIHWWVSGRLMRSQRDRKILMHCVVLRLVLLVH